MSGGTPAARFTPAPSPPQPRWWNREGSVDVIVAAAIIVAFTLLVLWLTGNLG